MNTDHLQARFIEMLREESERTGVPHVALAFFFMQCAAVQIYARVPERMPELLRELERQVAFLDTIDKHHWQDVRGKA